MRRPAAALVFLLALVACGPNARQQTLRTMYTGAETATAGFVAWDREHLNQLADNAPSVAVGLEQIEAYEKAKAPVVEAIEDAYRAIAEAALLDESPLAAAVSKFEELRKALNKLTGGSLP